MKTIKLSSGYECILDEEDYEKFSKFNWFASNKDGRIYAYRSKRYGPRKENKRLTIYLHREIINAPKGAMVDHVNRNTLDNRRENLRLCNSTENAHNTSKFKRKCSSKYKGVCWDKSKKKWQVMISINKKHTFIGRFETEKEAAIEYNKQAKIHYGEFAALNIIED